MAFNVIWHPYANADLEREIDYLFQEFGREASKNLFDEVMGRIYHLSKFPKLGVKCDGITYHGKEVRVWNVRQNAIVYAIDEKQITIIVFWNNYQDPKNLLALIGSR